METFETAPDRLLRAADFVRSGRNDRSLRRRAERGDLIALRPGVFVPRDVWAGAAARDRHLLRARGVAQHLGPNAVFSHSTAAALHGWASLGPWGDTVDVTDPSIIRSRKGATARVRAFGLSEQDRSSRLGLPTTAPGRTAVDLASSLPFRDAVVALDSALPASRTDRRDDRSILTLDDFDSALERRSPVRAHRQVARARAFADGDSGSPGESLSRVMFLEIGWPAPILQEPFLDEGGKIGDVDFWWPELGLVGEFDGYVKYSRGEMLRGRSPAQAAVDEKRREDRLRAHRKVRRFARWMWSDLVHIGRLEAILRAATSKI